MVFFGQLHRLKDSPWDQLYPLGSKFVPRAEINILASAGFGTGAFSLAVPSYVSEIAERSIQGALASCMQVSGCYPG
jgi:hypothetical protein